MINEANEKERARIFKEMNIKVHISKNDGLFYNGSIIEVRERLFILFDTLLQKNVIIFFTELLKPIQTYRSKEEKETINKNIEDNNH